MEVHVGAKDIADPRLGELRYDETLEWWVGTVPGADPSVSLYVSPDDSGDPSSALATGAAICRQFSEWAERVRRYAVEQLLSLKNDSWLDEDEANVTPEQFLSRMQLEGVTAYPDGRFEFMHADGELFWGHAIQVTGNLTDGPTDADIPG